MTVDQIITVEWIETSRSRSLAHLLRGHGVDLDAIDPETTTIERGTPIYVEADADAEKIERRMAAAHVRYLFVLEEDHVLGAIDLADLVRRAEERAWN